MWSLPVEVFESEQIRCSFVMETKGDWRKEDSTFWCRWWRDNHRWTQMGIAQFRSHDRRWIWSSTEMINPRLEDAPTWSGNPTKWLEHTDRPVPNLSWCQGRRRVFEKISALWLLKENVDVSDLRVMHVRITFTSLTHKTTNDWQTELEKKQQPCL